MDDDSFVRSLADHYGFSQNDTFAARDLLDLPERDLVVRFNGLAHFASEYGLNIRDLAAFVVERGTGIRPWEPPAFRPSEEDRTRINEAIARLGKEGHWSETILKLLDEINRLQGTGA